MYRDLFGDDGLVQNARAAGRQRGGAGGFAALEQLVRGDIEILRETAHGVGGRFVLLHRDHEQFQQAYPEAFKANVKMPPMGHYANPETEIGRVCVQLAMPDFKYLSGETLTLEGGMGLRP